MDNVILGIIAFGLISVLVIQYYIAWWMQQVADVLFKGKKYCEKCGNKLR